MGGKTVVENKSSGTQTSAPPSWTMPGISEASSRVMDALKQLPGQKYTGDFFAQPNYGGAIDAFTGAAATGGELADWTKGQMQGWSPETFQMGNRQELLDGAISSAINPVMRQLTEQVLPGIKSSALDSGAYSGDRATALLPQQAIGQAAESAQRLAGEMAYSDLQSFEDRRLAAFQGDQQAELAYRSQLPDLVDTIMRMETGGGDIMTQIANLRAQQDQAGLDNAKAKNDNDWQYPFRGLDVASSLLAQLSGGYGTTTSNGTSTQTQSSSGLGNILQGIMGGVGMIGGMPMSGGGTLLGSLFQKKAA